LAALLWFVSREQINYLGGTHISSTSALSNISNNLEPKLDESVGVAINGRKGSLNTALYLTQHDLLPNQEEKEVFDNAINNLIYESGTSTPNQGLLS
jgi:hypothetical protein